MNYDFVKAVVNSLNDSHRDYVKDICNNNLPKAVDNTILEMVKDGRYKKFFEDFETLRDAIIYLDEKGQWECKYEN